MTRSSGKIRLLVGLLMGAALFVAPGCGGSSGDDDPADAAGVVRLAAVINGTAVLIDPAGYPGQLCFGAAGCVVGATTELDVPDGTHTITAPYTYGPAGEAANLGMLTVNRAAGTILLQSAHFNPLSASSFQARTAPVTYRGNGASLPILLWGVQQLGEAQPIRLLRNRSYRLHTSYSYDIGRGDGFLSAIFDLVVGEDGTVGFRDGAEAATLMQATGAELSIRASELVVVTYQGHGTTMPMLVWGLHQFNATSPARLLRNRRYRLHTSYSYDIRRGDSFLSASPDLEVRSDGTVVIAEGADAAEVVTTIGTDLSVRASQLVSLSFRPNGTPVPVQLWGLQDFSPTRTVVLFRSRRYRLNTAYSYQTVRQDSFFSASADLEVQPNGTVAIAEGADAEPVLDISVAEPESGSDYVLAFDESQLVDVTFRSNGTPSTMSVWGLHQFAGTTAVKLVRNRRYRLHTSYSYDLSRGDAFFSPTADLEVRDNGTVALAEGAAARTVLTVVGRELTVIESQLVEVSYQPNGTSSAVHLWGLYSFTLSGRAKLLRNRRYRLHTDYSYSVNTGDAFFSAVPDLEVRADGAVGIASGAAAESVLEVIGRELTVRASELVPLVYQPDGTPVPVSVWGVFDFGPNRTASLFRGRRYRLWGPSSVDPDTGSGFFSTVPDLEIPVGGGVAVVPGTKAHSQFRPSSGPPAAISPVLGILRVGPDGYAGGVCLRGIYCGAGGQGLDVPVIVGRRYTVDPSGASVTFGADGVCSPGVIPATMLGVRCSVQGPSVPVEVTVTNSAGAPLSGRGVQAYEGSRSMGGLAATDGSGRARVMVPAGTYRFGASDGSVVFYSGAADHCAVTLEGGCRSASIVLPGEVANVRVTPEVVAPGAIVDVAWSGISNPAAGDTVGLYAVGAESTSLVRQSTGGTASGTVRLTVPISATIGYYEARVTREAGTVVASSNKLRVTTTPCADMADGTSCSDGNPCNGTENCQASVCRSSDPVVCAPSSECASSVCNPVSGQCESRLAPAGQPCDDGNACSTSDGCDGAGTCVGGTPIACLGGTACAPNSCNPMNGACESAVAAAGSPCSDGNVCTQMDACDGTGHCGGGQAVVCDDGDECSVESCDASLGCRTTLLCRGDTQSLYPVSVRVSDTSGVPKVGVPVVAYDGSVAMGPARLTDDAGQVSFALPTGDYHFTATLEGRQFSTGSSDDCAMGVCDQVAIIALTSAPEGCDTDEACTEKVGAGRRLHVVAASAGGSDLFHAIRDSNSPTFHSPFGDVLEQAGRPWMRVGTTTKIVDVAVQSRGNQLMVAVLIESSPACPFDPNCHDPPNQPPDPSEIHYSVWWTERHPGFWTAFDPLPLEPGVSFRSIALTGVGRDYSTFCGTSSAGDILVADAAPFRSPAGWTPLTSVKQMAARDPGFATRVSCQREMDHMPLVVAALVGGRAWITYADPLREHARPNDITFPVLDPPGFDDLTQRLALPAGLTTIHVGGIDKIGQLHLVAGRSNEPALHGFTRRPTASNWTVPSPLDAVLGSSGSAVVSTAVVSGAGHLQVFQSTAEGRLFMATRLSASGNWTGQGSVGSEALNGRRFGKIAASEEVLIPFSVDVDPVLEMDATTLRFTWRDSDDFEEGYRIYAGNSLVAVTSPTPGSPGIPTVTAFDVPKADLEAGRLYRFDLAAFASAGDSYRRVVQSTGGPLITVAQPVLTKVERWETNGFGCFACDENYRFHYAFRDSSVGPANLQGTRFLQLSAIHDDGRRTWSSVVFEPARNSYHVIGRNEYRSGLGGTVAGWRFTLAATGFDGSRRLSPYARFNRLSTDAPPPAPPPGSPPPEIIDPPQPRCCVEKRRLFGEE